MAIQIINATIQHRRGLERDFDPDQMTAGEWAVSTDSKYVWMCFRPGIVLRMATYEAFEADMSEIREILKSAQDIQTAINEISELVQQDRDDAEDFSVLSKSYAVGGTGTRPGEDSDNAKYYSEQAKAIAGDVKVTGVKGAKEEKYRDGNVNLTPENIGAIPSTGGISTGNLTVETSDEGSYFIAKRNNTSSGKSREVYFGLQSDGGNRGIWDKHTNVWVISISDNKKNAFNGKATSAEKAYKDKNGNPIEETYAKKSIYNETTVSMGRKNGSSVGTRSFAFGNNVESSGSDSFSEGYETTASGFISHAEGWKTTASGNRSHAEGYSTVASGFNSHSGGHLSKSKGINSFAYGLGAVAGSSGQSAIGWYNVDENNKDSYTNPFVVGNGSDENTRSNAFRVNKSGSVYGKAEYNSSGADYAEFIKEWHDGNPDNEDRVGYFVTVKNGFLYKAEAGDYIVGVTSGNPSVVGNSDEEYYWRWERDEFNRIVYEEVPEYIEKIDENGIPVMDKNNHPVMVESGNVMKSMKQREDYDISLQNSYIERKNRKEWDYVGMVGVVPVRDDGTCKTEKFCRCSNGGIATIAAERGFDTYMVIERISENIVSVVLK